MGSTSPDNVLACCDAAHECNLEARNAQYLRICQSVFARSTSTCSCVQPTTLADEMDHKYPGLTSNLVEKSDVVVWLGDLNYRVELPRCAVQDLLKHKMQEVILVWFWCISGRVYLTLFKEGNTRNNMLLLLHFLHCIDFLVCKHTSIYNLFQGSYLLRYICVCAVVGQ